MSTCNFKDQLGKEFNDTQDQDTMKMVKIVSSPTLLLLSSFEAKRQKVFAWGYGKEASLLNLVLNPEYGDITDVDAGTDLTLTYGKPPGASFKTTLTPRRRTVHSVTRQSVVMKSVLDFWIIFRLITFSKSRPR